MQKLKELEAETQLVVESETQRLEVAMQKVEL
jgi:hypothetical protein